MKKLIWSLLLLVALGALAIFIYNARQRQEPPLPSVPVVTQPVAPALPVGPQIRYPLAPPSLDKPLPALDLSDTAVRNALDGLSLGKTLIGLFQLHDFVRRVVASVDNLPRGKAAVRLMPVKPAAGRFLVDRAGEGFEIGQSNAARYAPYVKLADTIDAHKLVALYIQLYPLFQQAYRELGYPKGYFNDRLVEVIDHLLAAPELQAPIRLVQPKVFYQFADPELEARSAGQKILMRIGVENARRIKAKLREIRTELTRQAAPQNKQGAAQAASRMRASTMPTPRGLAKTGFRSSSAISGNAVHSANMPSISRTSNSSIPVTATAMSVFEGSPGRVEISR